MAENTPPTKGHFASELALPLEPIIYHWWFDEIPEVLKDWIEKHDCKSQIRTEVKGGRIFYELYIGQARNAKQRLANHLPYQDESGFAHSTLRRTLRALLCVGSKDIKHDAWTVDDFMIKHAYVEWDFISQDDSKGASLKELLNQTEYDAINDNYWHPLNIQENKHALHDEWVKVLRSLRNSQDNN